MIIKKIILQSNKNMILSLFVFFLLQVKGKRLAKLKKTDVVALQ